MIGQVTIVMRLLRQPELLWFLFFVVAGLINLSGLALGDWGSVWFVALAPAVVIIANITAIVMPPVPPSPRLRLARSVLNGFIALFVGTLILSQLPVTGRVFRTEGGAFLWALIAFLQMSLLGFLSVLAWLILRGTLAMRHAVQLTVGLAILVAAAVVIYPRAFEMTRDPIERLDGAARVQSLSEAYGRARGRTPRVAWRGNVETWDTFTVRYVAPDRLVLRVVTDYPSALAARPPLPGGLMTPRAVADPERTVVFWNARFDGFEILRDVGISSPYWRAAWEAAEPGAEPTLVWTHDEEVVQIERGEFLELCTEAERLSKGLFDQPQAWGYWAEVVEAWVADPAFAKPGPARDLRRARISLLQMAADCSSGSAACGDDVPRLLTLAETVTSMEAAPLPSIEEVRAKLNSPLYSLSQLPGRSPAFRMYFKWLYDAVEESTVYDRLGG